jgi:hypothetical protein
MVVVPEVLVRKQGGEDQMCVYSRSEQERTAVVLLSRYPSGAMAAAVLLTGSSTTTTRIPFDVAFRMNLEQSETPDLLETI